MNLRRPLLVNSVTTTPVAAMMAYAMYFQSSGGTLFEVIGLPIFMWLFGFAYCLLLENG